ncbi:MAG: DUF2442 domain-containing protein [Proteobacteria bacterium]|nr:DUF2442 domain-containing protein [Pseudomonadota bacterium]
MNTSAIKIDRDPVAVEVNFSDEMICLVLEDGREVKTPLEFYPRLAKATENQLKNFKLLGGGTGIHWEDLDEDLSVDSIVSGRRAPNA